MLNKRELGTVLAALRRFQEVETLSESENEIATDGGDFDRLTFDEINTLCETLNGAYTVSLYPLTAKTPPLIGFLAEAVLTLLEQEGRDTGEGGPLSDLRDAIDAAMETLS